MNAILDKFGRIVIPKKIREDFNLRPGSPIRIEEGKDVILLTPVAGEPTLIKKEGILVFTGSAMEDIEEHLNVARRKRSHDLSGL